MVGKNFIVLAVLCIIQWARVCECQVFFGGECLDVETVKNFDVKRFMGAWYEYKKYPSDLEKSSKCNMDTYELRDNGDVTVLKSRFNTLSKTFIEQLGNAGNIQTGKVMVQFKDVAAGARARFWVLDTDYENYSVLYSCIPITDHYHMKNVWIMTREKFPEAVPVARAFQALQRNNLPTSYLITTDQSSCSSRTGFIDKIMEIS